MADVTIKYKGQSIATMDASGTKTLGTQGKYCEGDIGVEYVKPAGPTGTKQISITENGTTTEDVTNYASAEITVNVQGGGGGYSLDDIATHNFTGAGEITITNAELPQYVFAKSKFTSFSAPNFKDKDLPAHWLRESKLLQTVSLPVHNKSLGSYSFYGCSSLTSVSAPKATVLGGYNFSGCTALPLICFPSLANNSATGTDIINNCTSLTTVDLGPITRVDANAFRNAPAFNTLILRRTGTPTTLNNISAFTNTPFASGGSGGTLYVPSALVNQYTQATNWSTILGYANNQILPIEGSIYETQYADGTPIT